MEKLREVAGLRMDVRQLAFCADYYRNKEQRRDPSAEELRLLDALAFLPSGVVNTTVSELYTNQSYAAKTYADMMNKRRELHPEASFPISLGEAFGLATAYLERCGKHPELPGSHIHPVLGPSSCSAADCVFSEGSDLALHTLSGSQKVGFSSNDYFLLIHRGNLPMWKYEATVDAFLSSDLVADSCKQILTVPKEGLLPLLLPLCPNLYFHLKELAPDRSNPCLDLVTHHFSDYRLAVLPEASVKAVKTAASEAGFLPLLFAKVLGNKGRTVFALDNAHSYSFESAFLRRMTYHFSAVAKLPEEAEKTDFVSHSVSMHGNCAYLKPESASQQLSCSGCMISSASCSTQHSIFRSSLKTALLPLLSLSAAGSDYVDQRLALGLELPPDTETDPHKLGEAIAAILGLYRFQCELGIPASALSVSASKNLDHPAVTAYAITSKNTLSSSFTGSGNRIYCVSPRLLKNGLPDFEALRHLLNELNEFNRKQLIQSVYILSDESITSGLSQMETSKLHCRLTDPLALSSDQPLAILLESSGELPYSCIGTLEETSQNESAPAVVGLPSPEEVLNLGEHYEITVLAKAADADAKALVSEIRRRKIQCYLLDERKSESDAVRSIISSQVLILCSGVKLPDSEKINFALRTLAAAGGKILLSGSASVGLSDLPVTYLADGLSADSFSPLTEK